MKKVFKMLTLLAVFVSLIFLYNPAYSACLQKFNGSATGGACYIKKENNIEKDKNTKEKTDSITKIERNLRPVKRSPELYQLKYNECLFGKCFYKTILSK
jgi:hypothetical protein